MNYIAAMFFINDNPVDIQKVLSKITQKRLQKEISIKGYPFPSDVNKYSIIASNKKANLCYTYGSKPTIILKLHSTEPPVDNWRLLVKK